MGSEMRPPTSGPHSALLSKKLDEHTVELIRRFFIGQMPHALKCHQPDISKIPAQRLGGLKIDGAILHSPDQQSGIVADLGQDRFQFGQVGGPTFQDIRGVAKAVILKDRYPVAGERIGRNF